MSATRNRTLAPSDENDEPIPTRDDAEAFVAGICFKIGPPRYAGIELERLVYDPIDPTQLIPVARLASALGPWSPPGLGRWSPLGPGDHHNLPAGATVTIEPGGQVELSTQPWGTLADCLAAADTDAGAIESVLAGAGLAVGDAGIDPHRPSTRMLDKPRYAAMERYFDQGDAEAGRMMMASTASVQLSVDAGTDAGDHSLATRWHTLHTLGPVLVAMFANSPVFAGGLTGWHSTRQRVWARIDPRRTAPPVGDPRTAYPTYALDAPLLCLPNETGCWDAPYGVTFADWIAGGLDRPATYADLEYHLSTLFPPVRAKGYLEVRFLDVQPGRDWRVPPAVIWALLTDPAARDAALAAVEPLGPPTWTGSWENAARLGLSDPGLAAAAQGLMRAALEADGLPAEVRQQVTAYAERYTFRGRSPADDQLEDR